MNKKLLAELCGTKPSLCSVRTIPSKRPNPRVQFRLRPNPGALFAGHLVYSAEIPVWVRRLALAIEYGPDSSLAAQSSAGNIDSHSIGLRQWDWDRFYDAVAAVRSCCAPDADDDRKVAVAFEYLRNRVVAS